LQFRRLVEDIAAIVGLPTTDARKADEAGERNRAKQMPSSPYGLDNVSSEDEIADFFHESISDLIASRKREREGEKFPLVHDGSVREYSRQEVDKLTTTQRAKLFTADPEMEAWWRGKLPNGAWPLFRLKGGIWIAKHEFDKLTEEHYAAIRRVIPGLLEWYLEEQRF